MHVLITGASGFIGRHAADALEAAGHRVTRGGAPTSTFAATSTRTGGLRTSAASMSS
jgi:nucleoside-diphosphate-sugar epimerase